MDNNATENTQQKKMEQPEVAVIRFEGRDVIATSDDGDCLAKGTKITMADGTYKNIEEIQVGDCVKTFNHETGRFENQEICLTYHSERAKNSFTLHFTNGISLSIVGMHDLFEQESRKYVRIQDTEATNFIGKHFYHADAKRYEELLRVTYEDEKVDYYEIYTAYRMNCVANGMLNVADDMDYLLNIYEFGEDLQANPEALSADVARYGLLEYTEGSLYSEQEYCKWNMQYVPIIVGKGLAAMEEFERRIKREYGT